MSENEKATSWPNKCEQCGRGYMIMAEDHSAPYHETEFGRCPCGNLVSFKSRYIFVDFIFED